MKKILIIDNGSIHLEKIQALLPVPAAIVTGVEVTEVQALSYDLVILSGSSTMPVIGSEERLSEERKIILSGEIPIIGICLGCELIAHVYGGTLKSLEQRRSGMTEISLANNASLFSGENNTRLVYEGHRWSIDTLPDTFDILATSEDGPEIIRHKTLPLWGLQFHPEHTDKGRDGAEIFATILKQYIY